MNYPLFDPRTVTDTPFLFFTGKGGVGKTSAACATALYLADHGKNVLLISTDPASNLQDVFQTDLTNKETVLPEIPNLSIVNLDPVTAAAEYRESVVSPYRDLLPESAIRNMEEQLSGSCTVEIASFNEFSSYLTDASLRSRFDTVIFDTAPTGHTLRMLQLPSAWSGFIEDSTHGASCLGQLSGLEDKKDMYKEAVEALADPQTTTLVLVTRPDASPLTEAERASRELQKIGIGNQVLVVNGLMEDTGDRLSHSMVRKQVEALNAMPEGLKHLPTYGIPLRSYTISGVEQVRAMLCRETADTGSSAPSSVADTKRLRDVVDDLEAHGRKVIFTMGKGGVGKTTVAAAIALELAERGHNVHLTTTDPAAHLHYVISDRENLSLSRIDEQEELQNYREEVLALSKANGLTGDDLAYIEEDLRSPCTQEIAVFRAFARIVEQAEEEIVVIDTAPTGHTLLLLESTESYHRELERTSGTAPESVRKLLPRLKSEETETVIVTLPEATPYYEASRLEEDLKRAGIRTKWWVVNKCLSTEDTESPFLQAKAQNEQAWIRRITEHTKGNTAEISWKADEIEGDTLKTL